MAIRKSEIPTYSSFLQSVYFNNEVTDERLLQHLIEKISPYATSQLPFAPVFFAIDYSKKEYFFWSDNFNQFGNHKPEAILKEGLEGTLEKLDPNYLETYSQKVFPDTLKSLATVSAETVISFNHRMKQADGKWMDVFQRCMYINSPTANLPLYCIGTGMKFNSQAPTAFIHMSIECVNLNSNKLELVSKKIYNPFGDLIHFTKQEKKIISCLVSGLSSKLKISINTVNNHRQNILNKTNCNNVAVLIMFAIDHGLVDCEF